MRPNIKSSGLKTFLPIGVAAIVGTLLLAVPQLSRAADLYWDANGATPGAGATPTGTWGTDNFWSTLFDGTEATAAWTSGANAIFSAGTDATGAFTVTVSPNQTAAGIVVEEGTVSIATGTVSIGGGSVTVAPGATLSTDSSLRISTTAGSVYNLNGSTLRTTNPSAAGSFVDIDSVIVLGPLGGTFSHITANILNIVQTTTIVSGPGSLTKTGVGVLAIASPSTYAGATIINDGELRIRTSANRLPVTTAVTVNSPGILNLNSVAQQIGSLSGNGDVGLGNATLLVGDANSTVFTGNIKNFANAGAGGVTAGNGRVGKIGSGTLTFMGTNNFTGSLGVTNGAITAAPGSVLCDAAADLFIEGGTLNLNNTAQTVLSLSGSSGAVNLGTGHTLTINPSTGSKTFSGTIAGDGALVKSGAGTLVLAGANTYAGGTTISGGTLKVANTSGSGAGTGPITIAAGAALSGSGSIAGNLSVSGTISPGSSPGTQNTGSETWNGGGSYVWEINDVDAGAGTDPGWDLINITGGLTIAATPSSKFNINVTSLTVGNAAGNVADFDNTLDYTWTILKTTGGITGFDPAAINLNTSGFSNPLGTGSFVVGLANGGNDLVLSFIHPPAIVTGPANATAECTGSQTFTVSATGSAPLHYQWRRNGSPVGTDNASLTINPVGTGDSGSYDVVVSNAAGSVTSGAATLTVTDTTAPLITAPANKTVCSDSGHTYASNVALGTPTASDTCGSVTITSNAPSQFPLGTTTVTWTATDASGNTANALQTVTVNATPAVSVNSAAICSAGSATLTATTDAATPGYLWSPGGATTASIVVSPTSTTTYTVTVTDANGGCSSSASGTVTVGQPPNVSVNSAAVCPGGSATLTATTDATNPTYLWSPGDATTASITVSPTATTTYTVTVTDGSCTKSASGTVTLRGSQSFASTGATTINDNASASPFPSTINVSGLTATVCRVTVTLNGLAHNFPDDIDCVLVSPGGQAVLLMSDAGGSSPVSGVTLTFDDAASGNLADETALISGTYKPSNFGTRADFFPAPVPATRSSTLSAFAGGNPNGAWSLYIVDDEFEDGGTLDGWSLSISTLDPIADVGVSIADIPDPVAVGSNLTYTVTVANSGPASAANVTLSDTLPGGATFVSVNASQGSCTPSGGSISCALGTINPSATATVTIVMIPTGNGTLVSSATVSSSAVDFNTANNSASSSTTVRTAPTITAGPVNQTMCTGGTINLSVTATGDAPLSYQWTRNGSPVGGNASALSIPNAQPTDSGTYVVVVSNDVGAASASATVTVNPLPTVSVNSGTICGSGSVTLTATHNASNPTYLWSPGGSNTQSIVVSPAATTTYTVTVTDGNTGCANSASGTVTVNQLTTATPLTNVTNACPGSSVTFSTTAAGTGPFAYVWRKNGTAISGQTGSSLAFASVAAGDAATYCVEVTGACNAVTNCATLTVTIGPAITAQPQNQTTPMGNNATFSVTVSGTSPNYQWQLNGSDIPNATNASYTASSVTLAQSGQSYRVIVSNCAGTVTSTAATLTVTPITGITFDWDVPGQFTNTPYNVQLNDWLHNALPNTWFEVASGGVNNSGALDLLNANGTDTSTILTPVSYDFSLNGKTLTAVTFVKVKAPTANGRNTQIGFVTATNIYAGTAPGLTAQGIADNNPQSFATVILQSTAQPALTYQLHLQHRLTTGGITEITPTPTPQADLVAGNWYKVTATFANITGSAANTLTIAASLQDMGPTGTTPGAVVMSYAPTNIVNASVTGAKNVFLAIRNGSETTGVDMRDTTYAYTTPGPIAFVTPPASQTVAHGRTATFRAMLDGEGPYSYQWSKNGSPIPGARSWKYITPAVTSSDNGAQYTVTVTSPNNTITSAAATLTVSPDPLAVVSVGSVDGCVVGVKFNQPVDPATAANPANYLINGVAAASARVYTSSVDPSASRVVLTPVSVFTGAFTVSVQNVKDISGNLIGAANSASGTAAGLVGTDINPLVIQPAGQNYSFAPGQFEVSGAGVDIFTAPDSFRYVYTQKTGDFDVKGRFTYQDIVRAPGKSGFNVRVSLDQFAPQVLADVNPAWPGRGLYEGTFRQVYNVGGTSWGAAGTPVRYPDGWLRLRRVGNTFMRYSSQNGTTWQFDGQVAPTPPFPDTVYFGLAVASVANSFPATAALDNYGDFAGYPGATIAITTQPVGAATVAAGSTSNLTVVATLTGAPGASELSYLWQRNNGSGVWTNVVTAGQTNNTLVAGPFFGADNGAQYRVVVKAPGAADVTSSTTTVTVTDTAAPTISSAAIPVGGTLQVLITYSEPMAAASTLNTANYSITNILGVFPVSTAVFLNGDPRNVLLTTASTLTAGQYTLVVNNVRDLNNNAIAANTTRALVQAGNAPVVGPVVIEMFTGLTNGTSIGDLTNNVTGGAPGVKFANNTPDIVLYSNIFGFNPGFADTGLNNYGMKIYTYFVPATSGAYKFFLRADDFAQFLMNTNAVGSTNPAGAVMQLALAANNAAYTIANSVTNTLVGGQRYYMELRFKETTGGEGGTIAVRTDNTLPAAAEVIAGSTCAFPDAVARPTPVVVELYTGQVTLNPQNINDLGAAMANGGYPDLLAGLNTPAFLARNPNVVGYSRYFGYNTNLSQINATFDNYLGRIYGNFVAPSNGLYKFYIRNDDSAELLMNTNAVNSTDPASISLLGLVNDFYDGNYRLIAQNVSLVGGQSYYMEGHWRDGTGGDGMTVAVRAQSDFTIPGVQEVVSPSLFEFPSNFDKVGPVDVAITPLNPTVAQGQTISFQAANLRGMPTYGFLWLKNGVPVAANAVNFVTQPLTASDNGAVFTLVATNAFSRIERSSTVTVLTDSTPPAIVSATGSQLQEYVMLTFSEPLDLGTGGCAANFQVNNGVQVLSATLDTGTGRRVTLRTTPQTPGTRYTVTVNGVRDAAGNVIAANSAASFTSWIAAGCGYYVEVFTNIGSGTTVANLTSDPKFINNWADVAYYTNRFGAGWILAAAGQDTGLNNYGVRITGLFNPPTNGLYRFYVRGDDGTQLFMNTNGPAASGRVLIARNDAANSGTFDNGVDSNTGRASSASPILSLNAGTLYYIEALMKEGGGGDHVEVALRAIDSGSLTPIGGLPAVTQNEVLVGGYSVAIGNPDTASLTVSQAPPANVTTVENDPVVLTGRANASNFELSQSTCQQWQLSNGSGGFTNIPGAIGPSVMLFAPASDTQVRFVASGPGTNVTYTTTVHSSPDNKAPVIIAVNSLNGTNINVTYNERVESSSATDPFNYTINGGTIVIGGIFQWPDQRNITITVDTNYGVLTSPFSVEAANIADLSPGPNFGSSSAQGIIKNYFAADVGAPLAGGSSFSTSDDSFDVIAGGNDIWGNSDVGHLTLRQISGNFDIHARVAGLTWADAIGKAGLMVRETTDANSRTLYTALNPPQFQPPGGFNPTAIPGRDLGEAGHRYAIGGTTAGWSTRPESQALIQQGGNSAFNPPAMPNAWVRITRVGNVFTALRGYDGVNWTIFAQCPFNYPKTVYVGFGTTAHTATQSPTVSTLAQYRDVYIPAAPIILVQPSPANRSVPLHSSVSYSVVASNPPPNVNPLTYQWIRNGIPIAGATNATLNIPNTSGADSGVYTVDVGNDGGTTTSVPVTLSANGLPIANADTLTATQNTAISFSAANLVGNDTDPEGEALSVVAVSGIFPVTYTADFNSGLPAGAAIFGNATVESVGGANDSGYIRLNPGVASQAGSLVLDDLSPNRRVSAFSARFKLRIYNGSAQPADGFSFNFGRDITIGSNGGAENGVGTGFSFCSDNYQFAPYPQGGLANTSGLKLRYGGRDLIGVRTVAWMSPRFVDVAIDVTGDGLCTVFVDGTNVFGTVVLPGYAPSTGRFGLYGRTGGEFQSYSVDDLSITSVLTVETTRDPVQVAGPAAFYGSAFLGNGVLHLTDSALNLTGSYIVNQLSSDPVTSFTATFKMRIGDASAEPADGFSFNFANDLPNAASDPSLARANEDGLGTGFSFCIDNYRFAPYPAGGTVNTSGMKIRYAGNDIAGVQMPTWNSTRLVPISISIDAGGNLTVLVDGTNVFGAITLPGWTPSVGRFGMYARTGGQNETHWVDDLSINATTTGSPAAYASDFNTSVSRYGTVVLNGGTITYTPPLDACGPDTYYYLVSDGQQGGTSIGRVDVTIRETNPAPPVITSCPTNRTVNADATCQVAVPDLRPELQASDNCCCISVTQNPPPGTLVGAGATVITLTVTDAMGLSAQCQSTLTVLDVDAPVITLVGGDMTVECHSGTPIPGATASDNCGGNLTGSIVVSGSVNQNVPGTYTLRYNVSDAAGNAAIERTRTVNVVDTTPPTIGCPANITTTCTSSSGAVVNYTVTASDACDPTVTVICNHPSGSTFPIGTTSVSCTAMDDSGNSSGCGFSVTVQGSGSTPILAINRTGANVVISWPKTCEAYVLQQSTTVGPTAAWANVAGVPVDLGTRYELTLPTTGGSKFFRLLKQ